MKTYCFTVDDNIRFLKELTENGSASLFDHPYLQLYRRLHQRFGLKVQLNMFYEMPDFDLSRATDRFREEFRANAHWLKLSFHSRLENIRPYEDSGYDEVYRDCGDVHREILRFAGPEALGRTTTVHFCRTTEAGLDAMRDRGMEGLLGLFGTAQSPRTSYSVPESMGDAIRAGELREFRGVRIADIDMIINKVKLEDIVPGLERFLDHSQIRVMIHEQYFYPDYFMYQPDFADKLETAFAFLEAQGYTSRFFEEML